ncbi:MAG: hypothetical protein GC157_17075 [Frankiales bacterium]|nr:hypothetical protein [Frankiales bacterium]
MNRRRARAAAALLGVATMLATAGCAPSGPSAATQTPIPTASAWWPALFAQGHPAQGLGPAAAASASPSATDPAATDAVQRALARVGLRAADFGDGVTVVLAQDGASLSQHSLAYCSATYPSEDQRVARRKVEVRTSDGQRVGVTSEVVLYRTPAEAAAALHELEQAAASCPSPRTVTVSGDPLTVRQVPATDVPVEGLVPSDRRTLVSNSVTDPKANATYRVVGVYQVRGRVLADLIATSAGTDFTSAELTTLDALAAAVAGRLAALGSTLTGAS